MKALSRGRKVKRALLVINITGIIFLKIRQLVARLSKHFPYLFLSMFYTVQFGAGDKYKSNEKRTSNGVFYLLYILNHQPAYITFITGA